jgi:phage-related protein
MTYPFWEPNKAYNLGDIVNSDPISGNGAYAFQASYNATSGDTQPQFSLIYGKTTTDNTQVWTTISPAYQVLKELEPSALIELFHIEFTTELNGAADNLYFHAGTNGIPTSIVFAGQSYTAAPVEAEGFDKSIKGVLPRPTLRVANAQDTISSLMHRSSNPIDPLMAKVTRIQTFKKFIDAVNFFNETYIYQDGNTAITQNGDTLVLAAHGTGDSTSRLPDQVYRIDRIASENQEFVEFELSSKLDLTNVLLPRRLVTDFCPWKYRGVECGYNGGPVATVEDITTGVTSATDQCGKRLRSCKLRFPNASEFDPLPFGGFPAAGISA